MNIVSSEENEKVRRYLEKFGLTSIGASIKAILIATNYFLVLLPHLISLSFLNMSFISLTILEKLGINILRKLTFPRKDYFLLFLGRLIFWIASTLSGSIHIPFTITMC